MAGRNTSRVDTSALKLQIERKFGHVRSKKYFSLLRRYFSLKINKSEFIKLCVSLVGRANLRLHNLLIQAIVKNANVGKAPPPQTLCRDTFSNSPRKGRTKNTRLPKFKDHPSPLGPYCMSPIVVCDDSLYIPKVQEQQSASLGSKTPREVISTEDGEVVEQASGSPGIYSRSPVRVPFDISINKKESRKILRAPFSSPVGSCLNCGELPDIFSLKTRLEQKLETGGLKISTDCVSLLSSSLDVYLKRLIAPCIQLATARAAGGKILNELRPVRYIKNPSGPFSASLLDFHVVLESNPSRLGEDWPEQLEKVCLRVLD